MSDMDQEIKFRAWWQGVKQMRYFIAGNFADVKPVGWAMTFPLIEQGPQEIYIGEAKIMRFTGLQDLVKVDCYEGDIVHAVWSEDIQDEIYGTGKVVFRCGCFMIEWIDDREANMELLGMVKNGRLRFFKIVGNVCQNPELLKK